MATRGNWEHPVLRRGCVCQSKSHPPSSPKSHPTLEVPLSEQIHDLRRLEDQVGVYGDPHPGSIIATEVGSWDCSTAIAPRNLPHSNPRLEGHASRRCISKIATDLPLRRLRVERLVTALVSLDLLSCDKRLSEWMESTESIPGDERTDPSNSDTPPSF